MQNDKELIAWMPPLEEEDDPEGGPRQRAGMILGRKGQKMTRGVYLSLLADRVAKYLMDEPGDPEENLEQMEDQLLSDGLIEQRFQKRSPREAMWEMFDNPGMQQRMRDLGIPGEMPPTLEEHSAQAMWIFDRMTLETWLSAMQSTPTEFDS